MASPERSGIVETAKKGGWIAIAAGAVIFFFNPEVGLIVAGGGGATAFVANKYQNREKSKGRA